MKIAWLHTHFRNWMGGTKFILEVTRRLASTRDDEAVGRRGRRGVPRFPGQ